jgi:hypothetical protein
MTTSPPCPPRMGRKPFQEATVRHAVSQLRDYLGPRRFLVADEVGLGKTLVAQGILQHLASGSKPFNVFYVCSSLTIANQNRDSLLEVLPPSDRKNASVKVDRPTLLPWADPPATNSFTLFTLTPGTLPIKGSSRGRVDERAAIWCLLREGLPDAGSSLQILEERLKLVQDQTWRSAVDIRSQGAILRRMKELAKPFMTEVRVLLHLPGAGDRAVADALIHRLREKSQLSTIQNLRQRLGRLGLAMMKPDLVILDEFQRFFELLEPFRGTTDIERQVAATEADDEPDDDDEDAHSLLRLLLGARSDEAAPAILLMSATPYRPPAGGVDGAGMRHYDQFFRLLEFLYGHQAKTQVPELRSLFRRYGILLRQAAPGSEEVLRLRDDIQTRLFRVIARTERAGLLGAGDIASPERRSVELRPDDVRAYRHLWNSADEDDRSAVTPYWSSIPYPLQMMDQRYVLRNRATPAPIDRVTASPLVIRARQVRHYEELAPPHPRMRALFSEVAGPMLGLPWLPPSLPWWPLGAPFRDAVDAAPAGGLSKILLFSRFRAVPRAVASLISFESERRIYAEARSRGRSYDYLARRRGGRDEESAPGPGLEALPAPSFNWQSRRRETGEREFDHPLLSLFAPAPRLGEIGDPQRITGFAHGDLRRSDALESIAVELRAVLAERSGGNVRVREGGRSGQMWRALIRLERANDATWPLFRSALKGWADQTKNQGAKAVVRAWLHEAQDIGSPFSAPLTIASGDLEELAELALVGPGVVLHRAAKRVFGSACDPNLRMRRSVDIALGSLRTYLDEPEFHLTLAVRDRSKPNHPDDVRRAIWHGNLEGALDEYFAVHAGLGTQAIDPGREGKALDALEQALAIRVSSIRVQSLESSEGFGLRCHAAMPFGLTPDKDERRDKDGAETRPDALRHAFNSPFRPFVLATTSIGQEGLDFHVYCDQLVHWDLPVSPVDLEQRDGRVNRYAGLAIRKALARLQADRATQIPVEGSPWLVLAGALEETCEGMAPWWGTEGAVIRRTVFLPPLAKQEGELDRLLASLSHYRLALGQSDPEQLLRALHRRIAGTGREEERAVLHAWLREIRIDLSPVRRNGATGVTAALGLAAD